ncbi:hypothetical protein CN918_30575 [Priestia megaterium]|nr:hypothetical protein CN918_30575 [Priestia megaterium]
MTVTHTCQHEHVETDNTKANLSPNTQTVKKGRGKLSIEMMKELAKERGGRCLSRNYVNSATKLSWKCKEGHTWKASPNSIRNGSWCPECCTRGRKRPTLTIEQMQSLAAERGGQCLSKNYKACHSKLEWKCAHGHIWQATASSVKKGSWCPACYYDTRRVFKYTINDMEELANKKGGTCLSPEYHGFRERLVWGCNEGHTWEAAPKSVRSGNWCPTCERTIREEHTWQPYREMAMSTT